MSFFLTSKGKSETKKRSLTKIKSQLFYSVPRGLSLFHIQIQRLLTFTLTGTPLKVRWFSPFILLGISVSASLFVGSKGNHTSPLTVSDCVDDIYACLSVWMVFFFPVFQVSEESAFPSPGHFLQFQNADTKVLTLYLLENNRKTFRRSPSW